MPLISVIIPIYNTLKYLEKCLNSVLQQTLKDIEIICIDDCSCDDSLQILERLKLKDDRIRMFSLKEHSGVSIARNVGLENAEAKYIMFLDSDDTYHSTICEKMLNVIVNADNDLVVCNTNIQLDVDMNYNRGYTNERDYTEPMNGWVWNKIWKKEIIDKYNLKFPEGICGEDLVFTRCYKVVSNGKIGIIKERLTNYLIRKDSIMSAIDELNNPLMFDCFKCADATYNFFKKHNLTSQVYSYFFQTLNYGIKWFTSEHYEQIAGIIVNLLKDKPNIVIDNAYFIVNNERYLMKDEVFRIIKEKFK